MGQHFEIFRGVLGQRFGAFGALFQESIVECFCVFKGGIWGCFEAFQGFFRVVVWSISGWHFGALWLWGGIFGCFRMAFWGVSGHFGALGPLGVLWGVPGQCFEVFGGLSEGLGALWQCFRMVFWGVSGALGAFWDILGHLRTSW